MKRLLHPLSAFLFQPVSASGFGLMRIVWAAVVLAFMLYELPDVQRFYGPDGLLSTDATMAFMRDAYRFSILDGITAPGAVWLLYATLVLCAALTIVGIWPRVTTIITVLLLFSFHERNTLPLGGGETVLRIVGFFLMLTPGIRAFSVSRLRDQRRHWRLTRALLPPLRMEAWPRHLLTWQMIVLYGMSTWDKLMGSMWRGGTAGMIPLLHAHFARFSTALPSWLLRMNPLLTYSTLAFEGAWVLLLLPARALPRRWLSKANLRRVLLLGGVGFHGGIALTTDVGSFSWAMLTAYLGLLHGEDFEALRALLNRRRADRISILYDAHCGLCSRAAFTMIMLDLLHRLRLVNFRSNEERRTYARGIALKDLDRSMHIRLPDGKTLHGFAAFRAVAWHLPPLWPLAPLLHLPGVAPIGERVYKKIAARRMTCSHEGCRL